LAFPYEIRSYSLVHYDHSWAALPPGFQDFDRSPFGIGRTQDEAVAQLRPAVRDVQADGTGVPDLRDFTRFSE
jgi:hypothetical protein